MKQAAIALAALAACVFVGLGVVGLLPGRRSRRDLARLAPPIGLCLWTCCAVVASLMPGGQTRLVGAVVLLLTLGSIGVLRLLRLGDLACAAKGAIPASMAGATVCLIYLVPWLFSSSLEGALHFTSNHDAFHFGAGAQWLLEHPASQMPATAAEPGASVDGPAYQPAAATLAIPLRFGFEAIFASILAVAKTSAYVAWPSVSALSGGLVASAATGLALTWGGRRWISVIAGIVVGTAPMTMFQVANQNGASLMGAAAALIVLALWWKHMGPGRAPQQAGPLVVIGLALAGLITIYWEIIPVLVVPMLLVVVAGLANGWRQVVTRLSIVTVATVVFGLVGISVAARSVSQVASVNDPRFQSPFSGQPLLHQFAWVLGETPYLGQDQPVTPSGLQLAIASLALIVAIVGLAAAAAAPKGALIVGGVLVSLAGGWFYWGLLSPNPYTQRRFVEFAAIIAVALASAGWATLPGLIRRHATATATGRIITGASPTDEDESSQPAPDYPLSRSRPKASGPVRWIASAVASSVLIVACVSYAGQAVRMQTIYPTRGSEVRYATVAQVLDHTPGPILVSVNSPLDQAWVALALADRPDAEFLTPCACLIGVTNRPYVAGGRPAFLLVDARSTKVSGDVTRIWSNGHLSLLRVGPGRVTVSSQDSDGQPVSVRYPRIRFET